MKHNRLWFKNRIGKKVYCDDHENKNVDWTECKGILIENETNIENILESQKKGVTFWSP
jgi:hypothetical protein